MAPGRPWPEPRPHPPDRLTHEGLLHALLDRQGDDVRHVGSLDAVEDEVAVLAVGGLVADPLPAAGLRLGQRQEARQQSLFHLVIVLVVEVLGGLEGAADVRELGDDRLVEGSRLHGRRDDGTHPGLELLDRAVSGQVPDVLEGHAGPVAGRVGSCGLVGAEGVAHRQEGLAVAALLEGAHLQDVAASPGVDAGDRVGAAGFSELVGRIEAAVSAEERDQEVAPTFSRAVKAAVTSASVVTPLAPLAK
jgi:hypothetical protein